jgi:hypothetical protein
VGKKVTHKLPFKEVSPLGVPVRLKTVSAVDVFGDKAGCYDPDKSEIALVDGPIDCVQKTLIHEIIHHWQQHAIKGLDDELVDALELAVYDLLKNRRELVRFLQRKRW